MARTRQGGRGGAREGAPGVAYPNRTDLNAPKPLAPKAAPSQTYGQGAASLRAQSTLPIGPPGATAPQAAPPIPGATPDFGSMMAAAPPQAGLGHILAPTDLPDQPVTHGSPSGPGPGPAPTPPPVATLSSLLDGLATGPNSNPEVRYLANYVKSGRL